jgi:TPP-dependent trihydroxycyclohexane-1,2-dione (THcHDO) dehydratase
MEWYNILTIVLGAFGGVGGFVALYKAKPEKTSIEVKNMQEMLEESHNMYNDARNETKELRDEFSAYKKENMGYVAEFKERFAKVEGRLEKTELAVYQGYRCPFPPKVADCPVLKEYEKGNCEECKTKSEGKEV